MNNTTICDHPIFLKNGLCAIYWNQIVRDTLSKSEIILKEVTRWEWWKIENRNNKETNFEHVLWMLNIVNEYYDFLGSICEIKTLIIAILVHDLWEYKIWDISQTDCKVEKLKKSRKKHERNVAKILLWKIDNPELKKISINILDEYFDFSIDISSLSNTNITILITKIIDFLQWFVYGLDYVFKDNINEDSEAYILNHIFNWLSRITWLLLLFNDIIISKWFENIKFNNFMNQILLELDKKINEKYGVNFIINHEKAINMVLDKYPK